MDDEAKSKLRNEGKEANMSDIKSLSSTQKLKGGTYKVWIASVFPRASVDWLIMTVSPSAQVKVVVKI